MPNYKIFFWQGNIYLLINQFISLLVSVLIYVAIGALFIQTIYMIINLIKIMGFKPVKGLSTQPVSVIVCAHNELANLKRLIPILSAQDHPDFEIIIVDDRSDDGTYEFLLDQKSEKIKVVTVDQVHDHINAKKYAITLGVKAAKNEVLLFTDADCTPASDQWIRRMTNPMSEGISFVLGVSQYEKTKGFLNQFIRFETLFTAINMIGFARSGNPYMAVGRNLAYRKSVFLDNYGFGKFKHVTGGDDDLLVNQYANKQNTRVSLDHDALTLSVPKSSWRKLFGQKVRHISVSKYYRFKDKLLLGIQNLSHSLFWLALVSAIALNGNYIVLSALFLLRIVLMLNVAFLASKKFGDRINPWLLPLMDVLYVFYITIIGTQAIFTKKVTWKK